MNILKARLFLRRCWQRADQDARSVPQVSKPAVSPISKSAERGSTERVALADGLRVWKSAVRGSAMAARAARCAICQWLVLVAVLVAAIGSQAAEAQQPARFLLIFETSPTLKKNLPAIQQTLEKVFSSNLQGELNQDDDVAVWTVDKTLHAGTFPMESWTPVDAESYTEHLQDFLSQQKYTRHAGLAAMQPSLNHLVKNSERLTVLIFGDTQCRLVGTPYDVGVNEIITNTAAKVKGGPVPLVLVLRSHRGSYIGCSVNRTVPLSFPPFPAPPAPVPPPVVSKPVTAPAPPPVPKPVIPPVPALVIVGTNYGTNVSVLTNVAPAAVRPPAPAPAMRVAASGTNIPVPSAPAPVPAPAAVVAAAPPVNPAAIRPPAPSIPAAPTPAPLPAPPKLPAPEPVIEAPPELAVSSNPPALAPSNTVAAANKSAADNTYLWRLTLGGGILAAAAGLLAWVVLRRRPHSSLITSSMQGDPRPPPRK
jgi:hypothetical protein